MHGESSAILTASRWLAVPALLAAAAVAEAQLPGFEAGGHTKLTTTAQAYPPDSLFRDAFGASAIDVQGELRANAALGSRNWRFDASWQLLGLRSESLGAGSGFADTIGRFAGDFGEDDRRLFDLASVIDASGDTRLLHRLDRLSIGWSSEHTVVRAGRQALTWGNGLFYTPMDLVNPFDPAAIDTEYKPGDDMLYVQHLRESGDDLQFALVGRRDVQTGAAGWEQSSAAVKYHGFAGDYEYDLLVAEVFRDHVLGIGFSRAVGGAQWSADVVATDTGRDVNVQLVTNLSYAWVAAGKNVTGVVEYYFDGFGQSGGDYSPAALAANPDLLLRLEQGRQFTLGRHYIAGTVTVEMTPLWQLSPLLLANLEDPSALLQLNSRYSLSDEAVLLASLIVPVGAAGTEFGGVAAGLAGRYLSLDAAVFAQFAWYF